MPDSTPTVEMRSDLAVECVHSYVATFKAALRKFPEARKYQALRVAYVAQRAARIALEGDAEEALLNEAILKERMDRQEALLPKEARGVLL